MLEPSTHFEKVTNKYDCVSGHTWMHSSHFDDPDYGIDYGGDYGDVPHKETKVKRIKKSRKRKIKILPEDDDDDDEQVRPIPAESFYQPRSGYVLWYC